MLFYLARYACRDDHIHMHALRLLGTCLLALHLGACDQTGTVRVLRAIDGDTLRVLLASGQSETVRIIGIDTPETVRPHTPIQCYGPEASKRMHTLADGQIVSLETRPGTDRDTYGRLLRYVRLEGQDLGAEMIRAGLARSYEIFPHPRSALYHALQTQARLSRRGLWGACQTSVKKRL